MPTTVTDAPDIEALRPWLAVDEPDESGEWQGYCPLHGDRNASASFNFEKSVWHCFAGCPDGEIGRLLWQLEQLEDVEVRAEGQTGGFSASVIDMNEARKKRGRSRSVPLPSDAQLEGWHQALLGDKERLQELESKRGLTTDTVREWRIGWDRDENAYTIPIEDNGQLKNVRWYRVKLQKDEKKKMWGATGHNEARVWPISSLDNADEVILSEGEMDTLLLLQHGFAAVTGTGGSTVWKKEWNELFSDKDVFVCYDRDKPGQKGAEAVSRYLNGTARSVAVVELPFTVTEDNGQDVTDLWQQTKEEFTAEFKDLLRDARPSAKRRASEDTLPAGVTVLDSFDSKMTGKTLEMRVSVAGRTSAPFLVPKTIKFSCGQDAGDKCVSCPMMSTDGTVDAEVKPSDPLILEMVGSNSKALGDVVRRLVGARKCDRQGWTALESQNVEELFVRPAIDELDEESESDYAANRKVYSVGRHNTMPNTTVRAIGQIMPNPRDQRSEFLAWEVSPTESSIDRFQNDMETHERLKVFQISNGQKPLDKLAEISRDLADNVTHIYGRTDLHIAMNLVWHSILKFRLSDTLVRRGWLEMLAVGDTRTGKSEVATRLSQHYRAGRVVSCESASYAGIVGGLQQYGGKEWSITWGAIPLNDRRLVVLDEVSGLSVDEISHMSSIRSSGVAELTKIQQERTSARTRLIWIGNPRGGNMAQYLHGVYAIPGLIGNPEDIARFDFAMAASAHDVDSAEINRYNRDSVPHVYTSELCRDLVLWAWSRRAQNVKWASGAEREVFNKAEELGGRYVESPPLIQAANVREKIARVAVAMAASTYSTDDGENVVVAKVHVRDAVRFLNGVYGKEAFGYREVSRKRNEERRMAAESRQVCRKYLRVTPRLARFLRGKVGSFRRQDLEEMLNISREEANALISKLWDWRMIAKDDNGNIRAEPELNELIRTMDAEERDS